MQLGAEVIGVSVDDHKTQCNFAAKLEVPFPMIGDEGRKISRLYGVEWPIVHFPRRITFVIDPTGVVRGLFHHEFQISRHLDESLRLLQALARKPAG